MDRKQRMNITYEAAKQLITQSGGELETYKVINYISTHVLQNNTREKIAEYITDLNKQGKLRGHHKLKIGER